MNLIFVKLPCYHTIKKLRYERDEELRNVLRMKSTLGNIYYILMSITFSR